MIKLPILETASSSFPCCTQDPERHGSLIVHCVPGFPTGGVPLVTSALTGGFFKTYLEESAKGCSHNCLFIAPLCHIFRIPCRDGIGQPLSQEEFSKVHPDTQWQYSPYLMCHYGYNCKEHWFVLFDDDNTLLEKAAIAQDTNYGYLAASEEIIKKLRLPD